MSKFRCISLWERAKYRTHVPKIIFVQFNSHTRWPSLATEHKCSSDSFKVSVRRNFVLRPPKKCESSFMLEKRDNLLSWTGHLRYPVYRSNEYSTPVARRLWHRLRRYPKCLHCFTSYPWSWGRLSIDADLGTIFLRFMELRNRKSLFITGCGTSTFSLTFYDCVEAWGCMVTPALGWNTCDWGRSIDTALALASTCEPSIVLRVGLRAVCVRESSLSSARSSRKKIKTVVGTNMRITMTVITACVAFVSCIHT